MKKLFLLIIMLTAVFYIGGCKSTSGPVSYDKLTAEEKQKLIEVSRMNLLKDRRLLSAQEKAILKEAKADFNVKYTGDKYGRAYIIWDFTSRQIIVEVFGNLERGPRRWSVTVVQHARPVYGKVDRNKKSTIESFKDMMLKPEVKKKLNN